jgi:hypothetical protein
MRAVLIAFCFCAVLAGCSSRKNLDDKLAKTLIEEEFQASVGNGVYHGERLQMRYQTSGPSMVLANFSNPNVNQAGDNGIYVKLLKSGYISQTQTTLNYLVPQHLVGMGIGSDGWYGLPGAGDALDIHLIPTGLPNSDNVPRIGGDVAIRRAGTNCQGSVDGYMTTSSDMWVTMTTPCFGTNVTPGLIRFRMKPTQLGDGADLHLESLMPGYTLQLTPSMLRNFSVVWFSYPDTDKRKALCSPAQDYMCDFGSIKIVSVSDLVLQGTETQASAKFVYEVHHNDFGKIVTNLPDVSRATGTASFSKKPDGTWVLTSFSLQPGI